MTRSKVESNLQLLTCSQACEALQLSPRKLFALTAAGGIPHVRIGRSVRYPVDELRRWVEAQTKGGAK